MANTRNLSGKYLNDLWEVGAIHSLYRKDGKWYHQLHGFPGVLFDANGYVVFENERDYLESPYLQIQQDLHVLGGISSMPNYVRITETDKLQPISQSIKKVAENKKHYKTTKQTSKTPDSPKGQQEVKRSLIQIERIIRDTKVSRWVKYVHECHCQICGTSLELKSGQLYAEAHHIKPLGNVHHGPDVIENILCVCPNHHVLLDYGAISIDKIHLLQVEGHEIRDEYINYHNSVIYRKTG